MKKIKEMYLSYDNAALTSNITNIDLSELIAFTRCLPITPALPITPGLL